VEYSSINVAVPGCREEGVEPKVEVVQVIKGTESSFQFIADGFQAIGKMLCPVPLDLPKIQCPIAAPETGDGSNSGSSAPPAVEKVTVRIPPGQETLFNYVGDSLNAIESKVCEQKSQLTPVAAIPQWWASRVGADRPQLIVLFGEELKDGKWGEPKYEVTCPFPKATDPKKLPTFPRWRKGSWTAQCVLPDNSRVIINAFDQAEALRVREWFLTNIVKDYPPENLRKMDCQRGGIKLKDIWVVPVRAEYYSKGQQSDHPDWVVDLYGKHS
jgi:hypothetical protein